jgi:transcriptional regulator with XRE-family HTH domain
MSRTIHTPGHQALCALLIATRRAAGLTQQQVAQKLDRPQSFLAKVERGERRLDVVEFIAMARVLGREPVELMATLVRELDQKS